MWRVEIALRIRELDHRVSTANAIAAPTASTGGDTEIVAVATSAGGASAEVHVQHVSEAASPPHTPVWQTHIDAANHALTVANKAIELQHSGCRGTAEMMSEWWTGTKLTAAWESVHDAEAELVEVGTNADVSSSLPGLWSWMQRAMTEAERASYKQKMEGMLSSKEPLDRDLLRKAYQDVIRANNDVHTRMRSFRNTLVLVSTALALLLILLAAWHAANPDFLSFCTGSAKAPTCPGGSHPMALTAFEVEFVGALGGLLAAAFLIGNFKQAPSRYNLLPGQLMLKPVTGAATAMVAVLLLQSGLIVEPKGQPTSIEVVLGYAALFGFSQELLTRLVDKRASAIIESQEEGKSEPGETKQ